MKRFNAFYFSVGLMTLITSVTGVQGKAQNVNAGKGERQPIRFVPFTNVDETGKVWQLSTKLNIPGVASTLGKQLDQMNAIESKMNQDGLSLRGSDDTDDDSPETSLLDDQAKAAARQQHDANAAAQTGASAGMMTAQSVTPGNGSASRTRAIDYKFGTNQLGSEWKAGITSNGNRLNLNLQGYAVANVWLLGHEHNMLDARGSVFNTKDGYRESLHLQLGGHTVLEKDHAALNAFFTYSKNYSLAGVTKQTDAFPINLGPIVILATFGVTASASVTWTVQVAPNSVTASLNPTLAITGFGEARTAINLWLIKGDAGCRCNLTFLGYNGSLSGRCEIGNDVKGVWIKTDESYTHSLNQMSGSLDFVATVKYWLPFHWRHKDYHHTIWNWKGFHEPLKDVFKVTDKTYI